MRSSGGATTILINRRLVSQKCSHFSPNCVSFQTCGDTESEDTGRGLAGFLGSEAGCVATAISLRLCA